MMRFVRRFLYKRGFRPKPSSIFYSPSLTAWYSLSVGSAMKAYCKADVEATMKVFETDLLHNPKENND